MYGARLRHALAHDFDADAPRPDIQLLHAYDHSSHPRMLQYERRHAFGERFDQRYVLVRDDHTDAVRDDIIGQDVAHVFGDVIQSLDVDIDVESHALRIFLFPGVRAAADGQDEIADKDTVGRRAALSLIARETLRGQNAIIRARRSLRGRPGTAVARDELADQTHRLCTDP